jgi:triphosphoribosyl-dephospho-CoA synthase
LGRAATVALYDELDLYPKPGLVSFADAGSHSDMNAGTFLRSLFALRHYFTRVAQLGFDGARFSALETAGMEAERRMLLATGGVNTHRGAIFSLGLLCAAAGDLLRSQLPVTVLGVRETLVSRWGTVLADRAGRARESHGSAVVRQHGLRGANQEAAAGMPMLFDVAIPALQLRLAQGQSWSLARLDTLFQVMAVLDDTNLVHRGGMEGLRFAQAEARGFISAGGIEHPEARAQAEAVHRRFVERRLSPGGAADVLAAACWVHRVCVGEPSA